MHYSFLSSIQTQRSAPCWKTGRCKPGFIGICVYCNAIWRLFQLRRIGDSWRAIVIFPLSSPLISYHQSHVAIKHWNLRLFPIKKQFIEVSWYYFWTSCFPPYWRSWYWHQILHPLRCGTKSTFTAFPQQTNPNLSSVSDISLENFHASCAYGPKRRANHRFVLRWTTSSFAGPHSLLHLKRSVGVRKAEHRPAQAEQKRGNVSGETWVRPAG